MHNMNKIRDPSCDAPYRFLHGFLVDGLLSCRDLLWHKHLPGVSLEGATDPNLPPPLLPTITLAVDWYNIYGLKVVNLPLESYYIYG